MSCLITSETDPKARIGLEIVANLEAEHQIYVERVRRNHYSLGAIKKQSNSEEVKPEQSQSSKRPTQISEGIIGSLLQ